MTPEEIATLRAENTQLRAEVETLNARLDWRSTAYMYNEIYRNQLQAQGKACARHKRTVKKLRAELAAVKKAAHAVAEAEVYRSGAYAISAVDNLRKVLGLEARTQPCHNCGDPRGFAGCDCPWS